jgi:signal-transduction protein with cAMP-binding, CBS, and nucleotidyltransferase domain
MVNSINPVSGAEEEVVMTDKYQVLPHYIVEHGAKVSQRMVNRATHVSLGDSALVIMTDLQETAPFSIEPTASIDATNEKMIACGVRLLFVTDIDDNLLGIVTYSDLRGEKPVQYIKEHGGNREDIMARDIMTPKDNLSALRFADVSRASVGDIIQTMSELGRQHTLVMETTEQGESVIRGIFSTSQICRQVGVSFEPALRANTFADVERAVVSA